MYTLTSSEVDGFTAGPIPGIVHSSGLQTVRSPGAEIPHLPHHYLSRMVAPGEVPCHHLRLGELQDDVDEWGRPLIREFEVERD